MMWIKILSAYVMLCSYSDAMRTVPSMLENIIVCQAQSTSPCEPHLVPIGDIADVSAEYANCGTYNNNSLTCLLYFYGARYLNRGGSDSNGSE